uniref:Protein LITTLE ZIPPER 2 n=1 Tax=Cicer arietinum TaxID=3827 RepID=A0A1S2XPT1_CICAR|nr:protein LITTLE ZIPPER 2 [Cicer arietinum]
MCCFSSQHETLYAPLFWPSKRHHLRLSHLKRRRTQLKEARQRKRMIEVKEEIKMKNLKLYMENQTIIEENEKLRKQAMLLHKENQDLMTQLQIKLSELNNNTKNNNKL